MTRATTRRAARITAIIVATLVALAIVVVLVLADTTWGNERVRRIVVSRANAQLTGKLRIDTLRGHLLSRATLTGVDVVDSLDRPVFNARRVEIRYGLWSALRGRVVIRSLTLDSASMLLDKRPGAKWNFAALARPSGAPKDTSRHGTPPVIGNVTLRHVNLVYRRPWKPDSTLPADRRDAAIAAALASTARSRTERVPGGFQRVVEYHDVDAQIPSMQFASDGRPGAVEIASLSMIGEPYRPPVIVVRSLRGLVQFTKDSLWWRGARIALPATNAIVDGRIGFNLTGMTITVAGAPLALADLRWLNPKLPADGGGVVRYTMRVHGDTAEYAFAGADVRYREASLRGRGAVTRVHPAAGRSRIIVRDADLTVARLSTAVLHELVPGVTLRHNGTFDGHVAVTGPTNALTVDADLRFDDARAGRSHVIAHGGLGTEGGIRARDLDVRLLPLRVATLGTAGVRAPIGGALTGTAIVNGAAREGWSVRGDLTHVEGAERSRVVGNGRYEPSSRRVVADATLEPLSLATVGRFAPDAGLRGDVSGRVHAEGTTRNLRVSGTVRSTSGGGVLEGRGAVALHGGRTRYDVALALDALDARAFSTRAPRTRLTGRIVARGTGVRPATADAELRADLSRSRYDTFSVDRLTAQLRVAAGLLHADTVLVASGGVVARAGGSLGLVPERSGTMHVTLAVDSLGALRRWVGSSDTTRVAAASGRQRARIDAARADSARRADVTRIERLALGLPPGEALLVDTLPAIRRDSLAGSLSAQATLRGNVQHLAVDAIVRGHDLVARGSAARSLQGHLSTPDLRGADAPLAFRAHVDALQVGGYGFEQVEATGERHGRRWNADLRVWQDSLVSYAALGSYARPAAGVHHVRLDSLTARFDTVTWRLAHAAGVQLDHGSVALDSVDLRGSTGGRLFANGIVPEHGDMRLDVAAESVRVATVLRALQRDARADGVVDAAAHVTGTRAEPAFAGRATLREARYRDTRAPDVDVDARYASCRLALDAVARDSAGRRVLVGDASLPLNLALERVSGSRRLDGLLRANVALDSLRLDALPLASRDVEDVRGAIAGDAHVRGTWHTPTASGQVALRGGGITKISTGTRLSDAVADLRLAGDTLHLDSLVAHARGTVHASGLVDFTDRAHPYVNAGAQVRNARVMDAPRGQLDVDGEVIAVGPLDSVRVTGRGELLHGFLALKQFNKNLLRVKAPGTLAFFTVFDTTTPAAERLRADEALAHQSRVGIIADLAIAVDRGNYYRNRPDANTEFYTEAGEELQAHIDTRRDAAWALGFVRIGEGMAIFRASSFTPARGTLTFAPYTGGPGYLEQVGERFVWEPGRGLFPVQLLTGGTSKAPAIGLESGTLFPMRGRELNGYLTIGRDETSLLQQSGSSLSGSEAWSGQLSGETGALARRQQAATALGVVLHDLGTGATKEFGLDAFSVSPADVPTELVFGKTGGVRGALIEGGRYVTVDRYLAAQLRLTSAIPGLRLSQRFGSRYRLDAGVEPRFLFRAPEDLGITHPTVRTGVFGAFLTRLWDW